jgi:hypothetical protein
MLRFFGTVLLIFCISLISLKQAEAQGRSDRPELSPRKIKALPKNDDTLSFPCPFNKVTALRCLFPGRYFCFEADGKTVHQEFWTCPKCTKVKVPGTMDGQTAFVFENPGEPDVFPYDGNSTITGDVLHYADDDGNACVIISFSTTQATIAADETMFSGRFSCAVLGLARFVRIGNRWHLRGFEPSLGCYGAFRNLPAIHLIRFGRNNYGCYLLDFNGLIGDPYWGNLHIFGEVNGRFKEVLSVPDVRRTNSPDSWSEQIGKADTSVIPLFGDLPLIIEGDYKKWSDTNNNKTPIANYIPVEIRKIIATRDSLHFRIRRVYRYKGDGYQLLQRKVTTTHKS